MELIDQFRKDALEINNKYIGQEQLILIECDSKRSNLDWAGRNDQNIKVILPKQKIYDPEKGLKRDIEIGDFVAVKVIIPIARKKSFNDFSAYPRLIRQLLKL